MPWIMSEHPLQIGLIAFCVMGFIGAVRQLVREKRKGK